MAFSRTRVSPRVHVDGPEQESFPLTDHPPTNPTNPTRRDDPKGPTANPLQPAALDATRLRRLSFGGGGVGAPALPGRKMLPALDRAKDGGAPVGPLAPLPVERPKFHHGDPRPRKPKSEKTPKRGKRGRQQSKGDEDFGQSALLDDELRGALNTRTIAAASIEMAREKPQQRQRSGGQQAGEEDSQLCQELMTNAPLGHDDAFKYWSRSLRVYAAQSHPEEFALIQLKLAQMSYAKAMLGIVAKDVLKSLESCLQHYNVCLQLYNPTRYPRRWGIAALEMGMAFGAMADLVEKEIPTEKPDVKAGRDTEAGFYKEVGVMTNKASDYRQRSLDNIESASEVLLGEKHTEERAKAQVEYARGVLRRLGGDLAENRELAVFSLERAIRDYEVLVDDQKLQTENPDAARRGIDSGPAHAYEMPVRIPGKPPTSNTGGGGTYTTGGSGGSKKPHHPSALAEDSLPVRLRGIKAAYGRALGTAGKLYLDKHASTIGGNPQSAGQAWEHLMKAAEVIPDDTRDRAEALLLLARATIEKGGASGEGGGGNLLGSSYRSGAGESPSETLEMGISHLRTGLQTCPKKQLALRQELHWHLGRLALARLQLRLRSSTTTDTSGRTPIPRLAREAGENLTEAVKLAQAAVETATAAAGVAATASSRGGRRGSAAVSAGGATLVADDGMRSREGWARAELAKLCFTGAAPDYDLPSAIKHLTAARELNSLEASPADYITSTCLLAKAFRLMEDPEKSIEAYREAARAAPLLGNQLHLADASLNPGAIFPRKEGGGPTSNTPSPPTGRKFVPALAPALRGLFGDGMDCCLEQCREELVAAAGREEGVTSQASFHTTATSAGGSVASGLRSIVSGKLKRKAEWVWVPDEDGTPDSPAKKPSDLQRLGSASKGASPPTMQGDAAKGAPSTLRGDIDNVRGGTGGGVHEILQGPASVGRAIGGGGGSDCKKNDDDVYSVEELSRWKPVQLKGLLSELGLDASGCVEKRDVVDKIARHPGGLASAAAAAIARGDPARQNLGQGGDAARRNVGQGVKNERGFAAGGGGDGDGGARAGEKGDAKSEDDTREGGEGGGAKNVQDANARPMLKAAVGSAEGANPDGRSDENSKNKLEGKTPSHSDMGITIAAAAAADNQQDEQDNNLVGMTLADYMSRSPADNEPEQGHRHGHGHGHGRSSASGAEGRMKNAPSSFAGSVGRPNSSLGAPGHRKVVRLAPAHIAPPSRPAPEWVLDMQKGKDSVPTRTVVIHRPLPFTTSPASRSAGASSSHRRHHHRRSSSNDATDNDGDLIRAQPHAMQAFRFLCRSGQLFLAEQLAAAGIWDTATTGSSSSDGRRAPPSIEEPESSGVGTSNREAGTRREGLRTTWMAARLKPAMRTELKERRERLRRALHDVRRLAGSRGTIFLLPRIGIETGGGAATGWDLRAVPSQREVVRALRSFEKWLCRGGIWAAQPSLALLTTCGTTAPRGIKAAVGTDGVTTAATTATIGEYVAPSDYPTDEVLAEMVDAYEALICWFYAVPGEDDGDSCSSDTTTTTAAAAGHGGGFGGGGTRGGKRSNYDGGSDGIVCFVAYHDEGKRRPSATTTATTGEAIASDNDNKPSDPNTKASDVNDKAGGDMGNEPSDKTIDKPRDETNDTASGTNESKPSATKENTLAELEQKRAAIAARARDRQQKEEGDVKDTDSSATSDSGDNADNREQEVDALDFEPGALRVRVILASHGTTELLRKATGVFLSAARNRNPVKRNALSAFALQDVGATLGVANVLKALPPHIQDITIIQHGILRVVPVHALPLEEASVTREPGRPGTTGQGWRPPTGGGAGGFGSSAAAGGGAAAPLVVLDRYSVRYTSSLYALELAERAAATATRDIPWYFNSCCVVEDPLRDVNSGDLKELGRPSSFASGVVSRGLGGEGGQSMELQHSKHEGRVVAAAWSSDPEDCHFCKGEAATREVLTTAVPSGGGMSPGKRGAAAARGRGMDRGIDLGAAFGAAARSLGGLRGGLAAVTSPAEVADAAAEETAKLFATKLNQARCLHLCCRAVHYPRPGLVLCRTSIREAKRGRTGGNTTRGGGNDGKGISKRLEADHVDAASLLKMLHLRSCGLVVLSRGGVIDDIRCVEDAETTITAGAVSWTDLSANGDMGDSGPAHSGKGNKETPPLGLAEAFLAAGAQTVVQKLWCDEESALVDTVFLLSFYEELREATLSGEKRPVGVALRGAQLWLRDATLTDILGRVQDARGLSAEDCDALIQELTSLFKVMSDRGSGAALDRPFASPYHWAGFQAMGSCGAVQSVQSLENDEDDDDDDYSGDDGSAVGSAPAKPLTRTGRATGADMFSDYSSSSSSSGSSSSSSTGSGDEGHAATDTKSGSGGGGGGGSGGNNPIGVEKSGATKGVGGVSDGGAGSDSDSSSGSSSGSSGDGGSGSGSSSGGSSGSSSSSSGSSESSDINDSLGGGGGVRGNSPKRAPEGDRGGNSGSRKKETDPVNKALKAAGSAYAKAGRLGGRLGTQAGAATSATPKSPTRASAPPGAKAAAAAKVMSALKVKRPKSPQSVRSESAALTAGEGDRLENPTRGRKTAADSGTVGACAVS